MGCRSQAQHLWLTGLVALQHVGSYQVRDQTCVSCIGRWILYHWTTRKVLISLFFFNACHFPPFHWLENLSILRFDRLPRFWFRVTPQCCHLDIVVIDGRPWKRQVSRLLSESERTSVFGSSEFYETIHTSPIMMLGLLFTSCRHG